jgi:small subunit ribosomal protein S13
VIRSRDLIKGSRGRITPDTSATALWLPFDEFRRRPELVEGAHDRRPDERYYGLMARLIGVDLPRDKRLEVALTYIYGIGKTRALQTLEATQISGDLRVHQLTDEHMVALRDWIEANYQIEGDLRREVASDIRRKVEIGSYQGRRHRSGLPVRGQRTRTNARSRKGARKPVAGKKKAK